MFDSIGHQSCKRIVNEKNTLVAQICVLSDVYQKALQAWSLLIVEWDIISFLKKYITSEESDSHNGIINSFSFFFDVQICEHLCSSFCFLPSVNSTAYSVLTRVLWKKLQPYYMG